MPICPLPFYMGRVGRIRLVAVNAVVVALVTVPVAPLLKVILLLLVVAEKSVVVIVTVVAVAARLAVFIVTVEPEMTLVAPNWTRVSFVSVSLYEPFSSNGARAANNGPRSCS